MNLFGKDAMQAALGYAVKQTSHVEQQVNAIVYPDIQYHELIPVDTSANAFAKTVTYYSSDKFGKADWINGNSDDIPLAGTETAKHETNVFMAGLGYGWGYEELNQNRMLGHNMQAEDAMAARRGYEEMVDDVAMHGDAQKGFQGLSNHTSVTVSPMRNWDTASVTEILEDFNGLLADAAADTKWTAIADTVLLPNKKLNKLATTPLNNTSDVTVLTFLKTNNTYTARTGLPLTIREMHGLETAGAGDVNRMIAYRRDPQTLKLHIPMPHRFLPVYQSSPLNFLVPGVFRFGGLDIRRPKEVRYGDGI